MNHSSSSVSEGKEITSYKSIFTKLLPSYSKYKRSYQEQKNSLLGILLSKHKLHLQIHAADLSNVPSSRSPRLVARAAESVQSYRIARCNVILRSIAGAMSRAKPTT